MNREEYIEKMKATRFPVNRKDHTKKGKYFKPAFERLLKEKYPMQLPTGELAQMQGYKGVALAVIWEALRGDVAAAREVMDRVDGKAEQRLEHSGSVEHNVFFENIVSKAIPNRITEYASDN